MNSVQHYYWSIGLNFNHERTQRRRGNTAKGTRTRRAKLQLWTSRCRSINTEKAAA